MDSGILVSMKPKPLPPVQPLPEPEPLPEPSGLSREDAAKSVHLDEVQEVVRGLEPGWYTTMLLHPRYRVWADNNGRRVSSRTALAFKLGELVGPENIRIGNAKVREYRLTAYHVGQQPLPGL